MAMVDTLLLWRCSSGCSSAGPTCCADLDAELLLCKTAFSLLGGPLADCLLSLA